MPAFRIVRNMEQTILSSNVNSAVQLRSGSVGEIHISVIVAIKDKLKEIMYLEKRRMSYLNARAQQLVR